MVTFSVFRAKAKKELQSKKKANSLRTMTLELQINRPAMEDHL